MAHFVWAGRNAAIRHVISVLFFVVLTISSFSANAAELKFNVSRGDTGGNPGVLNTVGDDLCPASTTNGCDFSKTDDIVRTNDGVGYNFAVQVDPPGDKVYIDTVLKAGQIWPELPGICDPFNSTITGDGTAANPSTLHCDLGFRSSFAANLTFYSRVLGNNPNGASTGIASAKFSGDDSTALVADLSSIGDVTITAQPHYNLYKKLYAGEPIQYEGANGYRLRYQFWIDTWKHDTNGNTADDPDPIYGNEMVTDPITFVDDLSQISPNAFLIYCPSVSNSSVFPYATYNSTYPDRSVTDAGTTSCSDTGSTATGQVTVTVTGADLSLSHYPTKYNNGNALPGDRKPASFGWLYVFVPVSDITAANGELSTTNTLKDFNPVSITGQSNFGGNSEDEADNAATTVVREGNGSFSHTYRCFHPGTTAPEWCDRGWWYAPTSATAVWSGDGSIEPNQTVATYTYYRNNKFSPDTEANICTVLDTRYLKTVPVSGDPSICRGQCGTRGVDYVLEYGVGYVSTSWQDAATTPANAVGDECSAPASNWYSTYAAATAAGEVSKVRIRRLTELRSGQANAIVTQLAAKSISDLASVPSKTLLKTWGTTQNTNYFPTQYRECDYVAGTYPTPSHTTDGCGDRLYLNRALARIEKTTLPGNTVNLLNAGGKINFQLSPSFTSVTQGTTGDVKIVDELPVGGEYVASSAKQGGVPFEPTITGDASNGYVLTWDLGVLTANTPIEPITFQMSTPLQTENNTTLNNVGRIDTPADDSSPEQRGAIRPVTVTAPASMLMGKSVDNAIIQQDGSMTYTVEYLNTTTVDFNEMTIIDVLPSDGDSRYPPSNFSGTLALTGVTTPSTSAVFYFSKDAPATLSTDPRNAANDLSSGTIKWCPANATHQLDPSATPTIGGASSDCPQNATEVTAVRLYDTQALSSGKSRTFTLSVSTDSNFGGEVYVNQAQGTSDGIDLSPQTPFAKTVVEESPGIGLAKAVQSVDGNDVTYHFQMDNLGNSAVNNVTLTDDLDATFGAGNYAISTAPAFVAAPASNGLTLNAGFTGTGSETSLLDTSASNVLAPTEHAIISVVVTINIVTDQGDGFGVYENSATMTGSSPEGIPLTDKSNNGTDSDPDKNGTGTDTGEDTPTPVTIGLQPAIETMKSADTSALSDPAAAGDEITYNITVKNIGNVELNNLTLTDTLTNEAGDTLSLTTGPTFVSADQSSAAGKILVGETATYKATYKLTQADIDSKGVSNTVTAKGTDPNNTSVSDISDDPNDAGATGADDPTKTVLSPAPAIEATKTADATAFANPVAVGNVITYSIKLKNTGNVTLTNVALVDTLTNNVGGVLALTGGPTFVAADAGSPAGTLKVGETASYSAFYQITQADINALGVSNTVTATGDDPSGTQVSDVSDDPNNTGATGPGDPTVTAIIPVPGIETTKTADATAFSSPVAVDDEITYTIKVRNTGNAILSNVTLVDTLTNDAGDTLSLTSGPTFVSADSSSSEGTLKVAETATYSATYKLTQADIDAGGVSNTVTATGKDPAGTSVSDVSDDPNDADATGTDDPTKTAITSTPAIETTKTADASAFSDPVAVGDEISYTILVKNTGNVTLDGVALVDTLTNEAGDVLSLTSGPTFVSADSSSSQGDLKVAETATYSATYKLTQADIDAGGVSNTVTATGDDPFGTEVSDISDDPNDTDAAGPDDPTKTAIKLEPAIETTKVADISAFSNPVTAGDEITYTIAVKNTGNVTLNSVALADTLTNEAGDALSLTTGPTFVSADASSSEGDLAVGETATYSATYKLTQADIDAKGVSNTVTAEGQDPAGTKVSDVSDDPNDADATGKDDPTKTAIAPAPAIETTKTADASAFSSPVAAGDEITYTIAVKNTGNVTLNTVALVDTLTNEAGDTLSLATGPTFVSADASSSEGDLLVGETATYSATYKLTQADIDSKGVSNTVTAEGEDPSGTKVSDVSDDPNDADATGKDDPTKTPLEPAPELTVLKAADISNLSDPIAVDDLITYAITVENTGNVTLNSVALTDTLTNDNGDVLTLASGPTFTSSDQGSDEGDLLVGEKATYAATYKLTQADIDAGGISNTVTAAGKDPSDTDVSDISDDPNGSAGTTDDPTKTSFTPKPSIEVLKVSDTSAFSTPFPLAGDTISYAITVKNTGNVTLSSVALVDTLTDKSGNTLSLTTGPTFDSADKSSTEGGLLVGETATYNATYVLTQSDIDSGGISNTVTANAKDPADGGVSAISDDPDNTAGTTDPTVTPLGTSGIETLKTADISALSSPASVGDVITYTITVKNTGNTTLKDLSLTDNLTNDSGDTLSLTSGPTFVSADKSSSAGDLLVAETATYTATYALTQIDIDSGGVLNTATATATDPLGKDVSDISDDPNDTEATGSDDPTKTKIEAEPEIEAVKVGDASGFSDPVVPGDEIAYTITLKNTGNVTLNTVTLSDTLTNNAGDTLNLTSGPTFVSADGSSSEGDLTVGETATYTATYKLTQADIDSGGLSNTATGDAKDPSGTDVSDVSDDPADATGEDDPTKTEIKSSPGIETMKTADVSAFSSPVKAGDKITYTITVKNTGNVTLDNVALTDTLTNKDGATLALTSGPDFSSADQVSTVGLLLVGETATYSATYELAQADIDAGGVSNTVTADGKEPNGSPVSDVSDDPSDASASGPDDPTVTDIKLEPSLEVLKVADTSGFSSPAAAGEEIVYSITVQNTGNVTLSDVALTDTLTRKDGTVLALSSGPEFGAADQGSTQGNLLVGETATYSATYKIVQADIDAGGMSNRAVADATDPKGTTLSELSDDPNDPNGEWDLTVTDIEAVSTLSLEKSVASSSRLFPYVYEIVYWVDVKNTGNVTQNTIRVADDLSAALTPGVLVETPVVAVNGFAGTPEINAGYNGATDTQTLAGAPSLAPGETGRIQITVKVNFSAGYPPVEQGNTAYGTTDLITEPVASDDPAVTPDDAADKSPTTSPVTDADGDGSPDSDESDTEDRDGDGIADANDYDPTGYFYCEETGNVLAGGLITVTGPLGSQTGVGTSNNITIMKDGTDGEFQFHALATGRYVLSYNLPGSGVASTDRLPADALDVSSLLPDDPAVLGGGRVGTSSQLSDFTKDGNPFHVIFDIDANDPVVLNNNIPLKHCGDPVVAAKKKIVGTPVILSNGATQITYEVSVENTGSAQVANLTLKDDLNAVFGAGKHVVSSIKMTSSAVASGIQENTAFNGAGDVNVLTTGGSLDPGEMVTVEFVVDASPAASGTFTNTVIAGGASPLDGSALEESSAKVDVKIVAPDTLGGLDVTKTATRSTARIGDVLSYTIAITNKDSLDRLGVDFVDHLPAGFTYRPGSAKIDDKQVDPVQNGRRLVWAAQDIAGDSTVKITLNLGVGAGVVGDEFINRAWVEDPLSGKVISTVGKSVVRREIEHVFDCGEIIGKVFDDKNRNGYQDKGEPGLPGVRVATVKGWLITTDDHGRYHVPCAAIPDQKIGSNFIMKLDTRTLPTGYRLTTENPRVVRLTRGKLTKLNFGASISRLVRIDLNAAAFVSDSARPAAKLSRGVDKLVASLAGRKPSVVRLSYHGPKSSRKLAKRRLRAVSKLLSQRWKETNGRYRLDVETRFVVGG